MTAAIFGLWRNWAIAVGILTLVDFLAPLIPQLWLLPLLLVCYGAMQMVRYVLRRRDVPTCRRFYQEVAVILLLSSILAAYILVFMPYREMHEVTGQPLEPYTPFISVLWIAPLTFFVTLFYLFFPYEPGVCRDCKLQWGNVVEHSIVGDLFAQEWKYQTRMLMWLSLFLSVLDWGYYILSYVNTNLNHADHFYFIYLPLAVYALSLVYLGLRYYSLWVYYCFNDEGHYVEKPGTTTLRYLLFDGDNLYLGQGAPLSCPDAPGGEVRMVDTPFEIRDGYRETENTHRAAMLLHDRTGIDFTDSSGVIIRHIYPSPDNITFRNIFHYFVFLPKDADLSKLTLPEGGWFTLGEVRELIAMHLASPGLVAELTRIYRTAMAWKTYDSRGFRLYPIKYYRPTFRFRDLKDWDVDYSDPRWTYIYHHNQDKPFFRLRRLFNRLPSIALKESR